MFLRLCSRAPPTLMNSFPITSGVVKIAQARRTAKRRPNRLVELIAAMQGFVILVVRSKSELLQQLATLSREELDDVAERIDELRGAPLSQNEQMLIRERVAHY